MKTNLKDKLRILYIAEDRFPPFRVDVEVLFGVELARRGHHIDWILQSEKESPSYCTSWRGGQVWVGKFRGQSSAYRRFLRHFDKIVNEMKVFSLSRRNNYDFILAKDKCIGALMALISARQRGARFIYWLSFPFPEASLYDARMGLARYPLFSYLRGRLFQFLMYRVLLKKADHIFVQSDQMKRDVVAEGIASDKITPVPMGVPDDQVPDESLLGVPYEFTKEKRIIYLGTLARNRRIDFLVRMLADVRKEVKEATLYLVGGGNDPEDEEIIRREAVKAGVSEHVVFTGFLPREKAWELVRSGSVCVSPFYPTPILNSTSPTKLIEYMVLGKAVVANDHPEQRLVIEESQAGLCVPYDEASFADAVIKLMNNPGMCRKMGERGRYYVVSKRTYRTIGRQVERKLIYLQ